MKVTDYLLLSMLSSYARNADAMGFYLPDFFLITFLIKGAEITDAERFSSSVSSSCDRQQSVISDLYYR